MSLNLGPPTTAKRFIKDLNRRKSSILRLASSYNNNEPCEIFRPYDGGGFNVCYFVRFPRTNQRWVVRFLMKIPSMAYPFRKRVESEVATMKLVSERTSIPVPRVHGYSLDATDGRFGMDSYIIMDFRQGRPLYQLWLENVKNFSRSQADKLYRQFADVFIQLRRLEFNACGTLGFLPSGQIDVVRGPHSIGVNLDQIEGLDAFALNPGHCDPEGKILTAKGYAAFLFRVILNSWARLPPVQVETETSIKQMLYSLRQLWNFMDREWLDPSQNEGPFVLAHNDIHSRNILVDDDLNFIAVLDWEWSHVVPAQFFTPRPWLEDSPDIWSDLADNDLAFEDALADFQMIVRKSEQHMYGSTLLADEIASIIGRATAYLPFCLSDPEYVPWWGKALLDKDSGIKTTCSLSDVEEVTISDAVKQFMSDDASRWKVVYDRTQHKNTAMPTVRDFGAMLDVCAAIGFPISTREASSI